MTGSPNSPQTAGPVRQVHAGFFAIALLPICIFAIEATMADHFMSPGLSIPADIVRTDATWLESVGRYRFLAATWFFGALTVLAVCLIAHKLTRPMTKSTRWAASLVWLSIIVVAVSPTLSNGFDASGVTIYRRIGAEVFEAALSLGTLPGCSAPQDMWLLGRCGDMPVVTLFNRILDIINLLAGLAVGALIVGMILCLDTRPCRDIEEKATRLADNLRETRQQLYLSSLTLTFGMFFVTSWMNWPVPLIDESARAAYSSLILAAALFTGSYFTMLILSFYLPVAFILAQRGRDLAEQARQAKRASDAFDTDLWLTSHNLKDSAGDYLKTAFALVAPILSAFAGGLTPFPL